MILPEELSGTAFKGFRLEFDLLYTHANESIPLGETRVLRGQSTFSITYSGGGGGGGEEEGLELRLTMRDNSGQFMTQPRVQVLVDGTVVHYANLREIPYRSNAYVPIVLSLTATSQLHFSFYNVVIIDSLTLIHLEALGGMQLGVSARTGEAQHDLYAIDNLRVLQLIGDRPTTVPIDVSLNLHDWTGPLLAPGSGHYSTSTITYQYVNSPLVSSCSPTTGPTAGGTRVVVHGNSLDAGVDLRCRYGAVDNGAVEVTASFAPGGTLVCYTPSTMLMPPGKLMQPQHQHPRPSLSLTSLPPLSLSLCSRRALPPPSHYHKRSGLCRTASHLQSIHTTACLLLYGRSRPDLWPHDSYRIRLRLGYWRRYTLPIRRCRSYSTRHYRTRTLGRARHPLHLAYTPGRDGCYSTT